MHTSAREIGQIYIPAVNWMLLRGGDRRGDRLRLVVAPRRRVRRRGDCAPCWSTRCSPSSSSATRWRYPLWLCLLATGFFLVIDLAFFSATLLKVADGGWFPLAIGAVRLRHDDDLAARPRASCSSACATSSVPLEAFLKSLFLDPPQRVPGTAVFLTATPDATPHALLHNLNHNKVLHERVVFLTVEVRDVPWVSFKERVGLRALGNGCWRVLRALRLHEPAGRDARARALRRRSGSTFEMMETSFFLSRELIAAAEGGAGMALWRDRMFAAMARNAGNITDYFNIPTNRVIELGTRVEI